MIEEQEIKLTNDIEKLKSLIEQEEKQEIKKIQFTTNTLKIDNFTDNVQLFQQENPFFYDKNKNFWFWNHKNNQYEMLDETDIMNAIDDSLNFGGQTISSYLRNNYLEAFKRVGRKNIPTPVPKTWIQFKDTIIDVNTGQQHATTPKYFITNTIPFEIKKAKLETPTFDKIFTEWVGKNKQILYEILAYCLLPDYPLHRVFVLVGRGRNGKSKYLSIIRKILGNQNYCSANLELITNSRFETIKLYKKLACFMGETNFIELKKTDTLKQLSGQDEVNFEFKGKNGFSDLNYAKLIIATNSLPPTLDKTDGFYSRWMIVNFDNQFSEKVEVLEQIPEQEYNNLALKSVFLLRDLLKKREFFEEGSIEERRQKYEDASDPLQKFLKEKTIKDVDGQIPKFEFRDIFVTWLKENGHRVWSEKQISRHMKERFEENREEYSVPVVDNEGQKRFEKKWWNSWVDLSWDISRISGFSTYSYLGSIKKNIDIKQVEIPEMVVETAKITPTIIIPSEIKVSKELPMENYEFDEKNQNYVKIPEKKIVADLVIYLGYLGGECRKELLIKDFGQNLLEHCLQQGIVFENPSGIIRIP